MSSHKSMPRPTDPLGEDWALVRPIVESNPRFWIVVAALAAGIGLGITAYTHQVREGLGVTGMNRPVYWGIYIINFVFFIGISHAGTLISAILRLAAAEWRRAITRSAEVITVMVIVFGVSNVIFDLGRPDRALFVVQHGRLQSPLLWDVCSISVYLTCSSIYLYLPLIPDIAILRDQTTKLHWFYRLLALGWQGRPEQYRLLERAIGVLMVVVIPIAVSVHTVVSFVFAMTVQPMWHAAIFGPYFVVGAIFSGIAALIIAMAIIRWVYHLEGYLKRIHFNYLGMLLLVMTLLWFYFTFAEYLTTWYGSEPIHMTVWWSKITGSYAPVFWTMFACCFVIPFSILCREKTRTVAGTVIASIAINIGMWLERFVIVIPTLSNPRLPLDRGVYYPTWVEWSMLTGCFCFFILLYVLFTRFFPIVSIWEIQEGRMNARKDTLERIESYMPEVVETGRRPLAPVPEGVAT
ncbi:MAG: polysulfide reductase NrfD [Deltaproteobacteria bacterium]|nr:polysulfide reductase NrfD [Deltaproteobacteria bacterium]